MICLWLWVNIIMSEEKQNLPIRKPLEAIAMIILLAAGVLVNALN